MACATDWSAYYRPHALLDRDRFDASPKMEEVIDEFPSTTVVTITLSLCNQRDAPSVCDTDNNLVPDTIHALVIRAVYRV